MSQKEKDLWFPWENNEESVVVLSPSGWDLGNLFDIVLISLVYPWGWP